MANVTQRFATALTCVPLLVGWNSHISLNESVWGFRDRLFWVR